MRSPNKHECRIGRCRSAARTVRREPWITRGVDSGDCVGAVFYSDRDVASRRTVRAPRGLRPVRPFGMDDGSVGVGLRSQSLAYPTLNYLALTGRRAALGWNANRCRRALVFNRIAFLFFVNREYVYRSISTAAAIPTGGRNPIRDLPHRKGTSTDSGLLGGIIDGLVEFRSKHNMLVKTNDRRSPDKTAICHMYPALRPVRAL